MYCTHSALNVLGYGSNNPSRIHDCLKNILQATPCERIHHLVDTFTAVVLTVPN